MPSPILVKSPKGQSELAAPRTLSLRERAALLMADGRKSRSDMQAMLKDTDGSLLDGLLEAGYLARLDRLVGSARGPQIQLASPAARSVVAAAPQQSVAAARMFLFDMCERLIARAAPERHAHFRDRLREARDPAQMMEVAAAILDVVEAVAGADRAGTIQRQLAQLMPELPVAPEPAPA